MGQMETAPCKENGKCKPPLGATTVGLIYVNPGIPPNEAYSKTPIEAPWQGQCGTGKGKDTVTAGFEGPWTSNPLKWDNEFFQALLKNEWEKHKGPGGHWQWRMKNNKTSSLMRLTSDMALLHDEKYMEIVKEFAGDMGAFDKAFDEAWFDLTTTYGSGTWSKNAKCDHGEFPEHLRNRQIMLSSDVTPSSETQEATSNGSLTTLTTGFVAGMASVAVISALVLRFRRHERSEKQGYSLLEATSE